MAAFNINKCVCIAAFFRSETLLSSRQDHVFICRIVAPFTLKMLVFFFFLIFLPKETKAAEGKFLFCSFDSQLLLCLLFIVLLIFPFFLHTPLCMANRHVEIIFHRNSRIFYFLMPNLCIIFRSTLMCAIMFSISFPSSSFFSSFFFSLTLRYNGLQLDKM